MKEVNKSILKCLTVFGFLLMGISIQAATLEWDTVGWSPDGNLSQSYTDVNGSGIDINIEITGDTGKLSGDSTPKLDDDSGKLSNSNLEFYPHYDNETQSVTVTLKFSVPVKLSNLRWRDIDYKAKNWRGNGGFDDKIIVTAKDADGNTVYANNETLGSAIESSAQGEYESDDQDNYRPADTEAMVTLDFTGAYVTELTFVYTNGDLQPSDPDAQAIWFDNFTFEALDTDGDGVADFKDIDDDNDGILDSVEIQGAGNCAYGFFHMIGGVLNIFDEENKVYLPIGERHGSINAMGYDDQTGKLYAAFRGANGSTDDNGTTIDKGDVLEINRYSGKIKKAEHSNTMNSFSSDFYNGKMYFRNGNNVSSWEKDTGTIATVVNAKLKSADFAIVVDGSGNPIGYGLSTTDVTSGATDNTELYTVDLNNNSITTTKLTVTTPDDNNLSKGWGATFVAENSKLYAANNNGYIYEIKDFNTASPITAVFEYRSVSTGNNDGASCRDANQYAVDSDNDGFKDYLDLDSDNDGIPDNVEAQPTGSYDVPSGTWTDTDGDGLADQYDDDTSGKVGSNGLIPPDTDGDNKADFLDSDSDNDGYTDCEEGYENADCDNIVVGDNGMASWVENNDIYWDTDHAVPNGKVSDPDPNGGGDLVDEVTGDHEAAYREFLCGKSLVTLSHYKWRLISFCCNTGSNSVMELLGGSLGTTYGTDWEIWEQDGSDNYEINATNKNTTKRKLYE